MKKIIINIILILLVLGLVEFLSYKTYQYRYKDLIEQQIKMHPDKKIAMKIWGIRYRKPIKFTYSGMVYSSKERQRVYNGNDKKGAILTIGCSYTEGSMLKNNETLAAHLNKITKRTVYNRGIGGSGPQLVYRQLIDKNFDNEVKNVEYIIYTFIHSHIKRQFQDFLTYYLGDIDINYKIENGNLVEKERPFWFLYSSFTTKIILEYIMERNFDKELDRNLPLFNKTIKESINQSKKLYKNPQFIFVEFPEARICAEDYDGISNELSEENIKKLKENNIKYFKASNLVGHNFCQKHYRLEDNDHPSSKAWEELVPLLVKELDLDK